MVPSDHMCNCVQRVCWYNSTKHLAVLRADFEAGNFSISHTPYKTPSATDEAVEQVDMQRWVCKAKVFGWHLST